MAKIVLSTYEAKPSVGNPGLYSVVMGIGKAPPVPQKVVEVKNTPEAVAAFEAYVAEAAATGKLLACSMRIGEGRKPVGFDKAKAGMPPFTIVNQPAA